MPAAIEYFDRTIALLQAMRDTQLPQIVQAAEICANSIARGGLVFLFGAGHSRMMCEEMTPRQGCFVGFFALVELALSTHASIVGTNGLRSALHLEKYEGYAEEILKSFRFGPHDAFIVISTSGIRPVIVEMALGAKRRGMPVIGLVSRRHSEQSAPAHSSGKKLIDIADVVSRWSLVVRRLAFCGWRLAGKSMKRIKLKFTPTHGRSGRASSANDQ